MRAVDVFSGCGGLSLGFMSAGVKVAAAYDNWEKAVACYRANFSHPAFLFDLSLTDEAAKEISRWNPDVIIGGPPCQDFSHAGKRKERKMANLTVCFAAIAAKVAPRWVVMENVGRTRDSKAYAKARTILKGAGYGLTERVLDASLCGVPQKRTRFFCIGFLGARDGFLDGLIDGNLASKPMTIRDCLGNELGVGHYYRHPRNYSRRAIFSIDEPAPTIRGVNRPVPKGYPGHSRDSAPLTGRIRPLTTLERARIQTFPKDFAWIGSKTDLEQMIGNAVPIKLAGFVARTIMKFQRKDANRDEHKRPLLRRREVSELVAH